MNNRAINARLTMEDLKNSAGIGLLGGAICGLTAAGVVNKNIPNATLFDYMMAITCGVSVGLITGFSLSAYSFFRRNERREEEALNVIPDHPPILDYTGNFIL